MAAADGEAGVAPKEPLSADGAAWNSADPAERLGEFTNFTKNAALMGAALMMLLLPRPWPYSL